MVGPGQAERVRVVRVGGASAGERADAVVVEEPLQVHVEQGDLVALLGSTMRTPGHDLELAAGLAVAEGVVTAREHVRDIRHCVAGTTTGTALPNDVTVTVTADAHVVAERLARVQHPSSACGMCGRDEIDALLSRVPTIDDVTTVDPAVLVGLPERMRARQSVFDRTGGLHAAGLATVDGELLVVREDVGRHNAVDKVIGHTLLAGTVGAAVLVVSGRAGFEIVQKAAMAGIGVVVAVSAPTSLSVAAARSAGIALAGFVRGDRMTVYAGAERLATPAAVAAW